MNFISTNYKKTIVFNSILIVIVLVFRIINLFSGYINIYDYVINISDILGLLLGLVYAIYGYKKNEAKYYKGYIIAFFISCLIDVACEIPYIGTLKYSSMFSTIANFIRVIPLFLLAFVKDLGKRNSTICSYIVLALSLFILGRTTVLYADDIDYIGICLSETVMAVIECIFINEKYKDKDSRGTK